MLRLEIASATLRALGCLAVCLFTFPAPADEKNGDPNPPPAGVDGAASPEEQIRRALNEPASLTVKEAPLREVAQQLRKMTNLNVLIDRKALDDVGISDDTPVTGSLRDISLRSVLNLL